MGYSWKLCFHYRGPWLVLAHASMRCNDQVIVAYRCVCVSVYLCVHLSVYPSTFRKCFSNMLWWIFVILQYNDHQVGDIRVVQELGVKGHLGVNWGRCLNMLKMLICLHNLIEFDENLGEGILGWRFFRGVQEFLIGGHLGVFRGHCWSLSFQVA